MDSNKVPLLKPERKILRFCSTATLLSASIGLSIIGARPAAAQGVGYIQAAISVVKTLYSANDWYTCYVQNNCQSDVVTEGDNVMAGVESVTLNSAYGYLAADAHSLFDRAARDYGQPNWSCPV